MDQASRGKTLAALFLGILLAYLCANALSHALVTFLRLPGPAGMIVSIVSFAVVFFAILGFLQTSLHIVFFGTGRD